MTGLLRRLARHPQGRIGLVVLTLVVLLALLGPLLYPQDPWAFLGMPNLPPFTDWDFPLGTDPLGRDILAGVISGARISLLAGSVTTIVALAVGIAVGAAAGYYGGAVDYLLMRLTETFQTIPPFILAIVIVAILSPSIESITLAIATISWPGVARIVRGEYLSLRSREFALAGRAMGMSGGRIIFSELLPNAISPAIVTASITMALAILAEAGLSFLGLGDPNIMSWGTMIAVGREVLRTAIHVSAIPGIAVLVTVLAVNLLGEGLSDVLNPKLTHD